MIRTTNNLELNVMKYNPTSNLKLKDQVGTKILQHIKAVRRIFSDIVYDVTIDHFEGEFSEWYMEFNVGIDTFIKSIVKAYNGMPRQLKPWALLFIGMMNVQVDVEGNIKMFNFLLQKLL